MTAPGTVVPYVRAKLIERLSLRLPGVAVGYHPPIHHVDLTAPLGGPLEAVWLFGTATADTVEPGSLGSPVLIAELWTQTVVIQVLGRDTSYRQEEIDVRCAELFGVAVDDVCSDPRLGLTVDGWGSPTVTARAWRWQSGVLLRTSGTETPNARVELDLQVRASRC